MTICDRCGRALQVGDFPFCKGTGVHGPWNVNVIDDQLEGGARWCETMGHEPVWLDGTKSQWKREMEAHGLRNVARHDAHWHRQQHRRHDEELRDTQPIRA